MKRKISAGLIMVLMVNLFYGLGFVLSDRASAASSPISMISSSPANGETNVLVNTRVKMVFNQKVKPTGRTAGYITKNIDNTMERLYTASVTTATYEIEMYLPSQLQYGTTYTVQVPSDAFIGENGSMVSAQRLTFTTERDSSPILATVLSPINGSAGVNVGTKPTITFNRNIKLNPAYTNGGVTLRNAKTGAVVSATVTASGNNTVTILPASNLEPETTYYIDIAPYGIQDWQGNSSYYSGINGSSQWYFTTAVYDKTPPVLQSSVMYDNSTIRLLYDEQLTASKYLSSSAFTVTVNGENRRISYVSVANESVFVNLEVGVAVGQDVRINYSGSNSSSWIQDLSGNVVPSFYNRVVTNGIDSVSPKPKSSSYASGGSVTLYFNDTLKSPPGNAYQQFRVTADGVDKGISSLSHSGSTITLHLSGSISNGEVVKVSYTPGSNPLQDYRGVNIAGFEDFFVRNINDSIAPKFIGAEGSNNKIALNFDEELRTTSLPLKSQFSVLVNNSPIYVTAVEVLSNRVLLTLASSFTQSQTVTISYVPGTNGIADLNGNRAGYLNLEPVNYSAVAEGVRSATIKEDTLTVVFNTTLKSNGYLPLNQFSVLVDKMSASLQSATISGNTLTLKLTSAVKAGQIVTLSYLTGAAPLQDTSDNVIKSFNNLAVQNVTGGQAQGTQATSGAQPDYLAAMSNAEFGVVGYLMNISTASVSNSSSRFGQSINKYQIDNVKLQTIFKFLKDSNVAERRIVFEVPSTEKAAEVVVPMAALMEMYSSGKTGTFAVKYNTVMYELPIEKIPYLEISRSLNVGTLTSAYLTIQLEPVSKVQIPELIYNNGATTTPLMDPIQLHVSAQNGLTSSSVIDVVVKGQIYMQASNPTSSSQFSLVKYNLLARTASFLPSNAKGGGSNLIFTGQVNGNAAVGPVAGFSYFTDTANHWANQDISDLASRLIVESRSGAKFEPNKNITRAEFAVFIAKGLGLEGDASNASRFSDVQKENVNAAYIGAAAKAGIINGNTDGTFKPGRFITREQMALMMVRAMEYAGHDIYLGSSSVQILGKFKDGAKIQSKETVAKAVKEGIIQGVSTTQFQPTGNATRAQAAVMLKRVLDKLNYL